MKNRRFVPRDTAELEEFVKALVKIALRDPLDDLHSGISPSSKTGDYSDVKVVSPYGEIPWTNVARISDNEMRALMIAAVDLAYTVFLHPELLKGPWGADAARHWNRPRDLIAAGEM
jgi:hypothetical protein